MVIIYFSFAVSVIRQCKFNGGACVERRVPASHAAAVECMRRGPAGVRGQLAARRRTRRRPAPAALPCHTLHRSKISRVRKAFIKYFYVIVNVHL